MSKRRNKPHEEHVSEAWLIPYADILTLLLALFIVLFSMSSVDAQKFQSLAQSFQSAFTGGEGVLEFQTPIPPEFDTSDIGPIDKELDDNENLNKDSLAQQLAEQFAADLEQLGELQDVLNQYIEDKGLIGKLETSLTDEGLMILIGDKVLFESGSANVRTNDLYIANEISELLIMNPPRNIVISGHTDNVPIGTARFESNWDLSMVRAMNFMKILLRNDQLDPRWFSAKGYGEYQPIESNDTSEGRAKNRRVEILIMPNSINISEISSMNNS
jgi:chemotaxis protein MotB